MLTSVYVTHDQVEAMTLADVLFVLNKSVVEQPGPPLEVFARSRTRFVASFPGSPGMNFLDARLELRSGPSVRVALATHTYMSPRNVHLFDSEAGVSLRAVS